MTQDEALSDDYFSKRKDETVIEYAERMRNFISLLRGLVELHAGIHFDADELIERLDFIIAQPDDGLRAMRWDLVTSIERTVSRILDVTVLARIDVHARRAAEDDQGFVGFRRPLERPPFAEVIAHLRAGITVHDVNVLALGDDWWNVISGWVDEQRGLK